MVRTLIPKVQECHDLAARARPRDDGAATVAERRQFLEDEQRWLRLAAGHESAKRLSDFLDQTSEWLAQQLVAPDRVPGSVSEIEPSGDFTFQPFCSACSVPLWFVSVDDRPRARQWVFECRACDHRFEIPSQAGFKADGLANQYVSEAAE